MATRIYRILWPEGTSDTGSSSLTFFGKSSDGNVDEGESGGTTERRLPSQRQFFTFMEPRIYILIC